MASIISKLDNMKTNQGHSLVNDVRAAQIGSGMRGDKRRTYRFQDDAVVDHLTEKKTTCKKFMRGEIDLLWPQKKELK